MWVTSSQGCPQFLWHDGVGHDPLFVITCLVCSSLAASLVNHLCCCGGDFWWLLLSIPSLPVYEISCGGCLFCAIKIEGEGLKMEFSIVSRTLVDTLSPSAMFLFPSGFLVVFLKRLQFTSWILWGLLWLVPDFFLRSILYFLLCCDPHLMYSICLGSLFYHPGFLLRGARTRLELILGFYY